MKKTINLAFLYAILAMIGGVFYREFTKLSGFDGRTALSFVHTHLFLLGMVMFLIVTFCIKLFAIQESKKYRAFIIVYNIGVLLTSLMLRSVVFFSKWGGGGQHTDFCGKRYDFRLCRYWTHSGWYRYDSPLPDAEGEGEGIMHVAKKYLLLTAGIVWAAAGFNIVRIGWLSTSYMSIATAAAAVITFLIFYHMIFKKLIHKHTERILANTEDRMHILRFFDAKSYIIMICMMSFGIALRASHLWPDVCIKSFYTGLGCALLAAGIGFIRQYVKTSTFRLHAN